ncbi:DNA-binding response regulator [Clostridioides difficile]|uniref:replication protein n=1 Tax=Clostridioides difficile TaxID=1496 RepID=UPI000D1F0721|nr:replication protein [Clostridioides difficile]MCA0540236.1 DNA-binding response regulator [Clostridioides difficile]MDL5068771.1 DNA-binding response regulator [Clostridioides difficile]MDS6334018.1 DNA-binding response regulator [Clostridioides difficile]HBF7900809.1 DNA-binding response regulator [Clostridioides difficile]
MGLRKYKRKLFDKTTDGYIQVLKLSTDKKVQIENLRYEDLNEIENKYEGQEDVFITPNTMYLPKRQVKNIRQLRALFQDIDCEKIGLEKSETVYLIWILHYKGKVPKPSIVVDSGRGLHVYWTIENAPYGALQTWQELQDYLYHQLKHIGADKRATDGARVLRLPDTINSRSKTTCKVLYSEEIEYSMYDLREQYLNYKPKSHQLKLQQAKNTDKKVIYNKFFNSYSLHMARAEDLETLCKLRKYDVKGHRNMIIHCFAYWKGIYIRDEFELQNTVIELNNSFIEPLKENEILSIVRSVGKAIDKFIEYEQGIRRGQDKRVTKGMRDKGGYWYKNETLIDRLEITKQEQKYLKTIIGTDEKYKRNNERRTPRNENGLTKREQQKQDLINKVKELKKQRIKQNEIAEILGITKGRVSQIVKEINKK